MKVRMYKGMINYIQNEGPQVLENDKLYTK